MTAADPLLVDEGAHIADPLAAHDLTPDYPVERAAPAQFARALRHHACAVHVLARESPFPALPHLLTNPVFEVFDGVAADAKFDQMKCHVRSATECDEIIARLAALTTHRPRLSSEDGLAYCVGASGVGTARAGAGLGEGRACASACGGRRGRLGGAPGGGAALPGASCGRRWAGGGPGGVVVARWGHT